MALLRTPAAAWVQARRAFSGTGNAQRLVYGALGSMALRSSSLGLGMLVGVLLARMLGATGYGIYAYATIWLAFLTVPASLGFDHVLLRYVPVYRETGDWPALRGLLEFGMGRVMVAAVLVGLAAIATIAVLPGFGQDQKMAMAITLALLPVVVMARFRQTVLRGLHHPALAQVPESLLYPGLMIVIAAGAYVLMDRRLTVIGAALVNAIAWVMTAAVGTAILVRRIPEPVRLASKEYHTPNWMAMVPALLFVGGAHHLVSRGHVMVLGALGTSHDVALFTVASRGAEFVLLMFEAVTFVGVPLFSGIYASGNREELQRFVILAARTILWWTLPLYAVLLVIAPWLLKLFGPEFVGATSVMRILATAFFLSSLAGFVIPMFYVIGRQGDVAVVAGGVAAVNLGLSLALVPRWGIMGAALAATVSAVLMSGTLAVVFYRRLGIVSLPFSLQASTRPGVFHG